MKSFSVFIDNGNNSSNHAYHFVEEAESFEAAAKIAVAKTFGDGFITGFLATKMKGEITNEVISKIGKVRINTVRGSGVAGQKLSFGNWDIATLDVRDCAAVSRDANAVRDAKHAEEEVVS